MRSASVSTATSMLLISGICGAANAVDASRSRRRSAAGLMRLEWNGAETGKGKARLAPWALSTSQAFSTAALLPAITVCAGSLKLTASTTSALSAPKPACASAQPAFTPSASMPRMAAIAPAPTGTASCMAAARKCTSGTASARLSTPAATRALYSPSEWHATAAGTAPTSARHTRQAATPATSITGWVLVVRPRLSLGPSWIRRPRSSPRASEASRKVSATTGWSPQASSMPTDWEPWPGKTNAKVLAIVSSWNTNEIRPQRFPGKHQQLHSQEYGTPGEAATHAFEHDDLAGPDLAGADGVVRGQRDGGRRGVSMLVHRHDHLVHGHLRLARRALDDADVGLVRNQPVGVGVLE